MSEPTSGTILGVAGWKLIGGLAGLGAFGAGLAALVVMCMTRPKGDKEWVVALISTFMSSLCGCAAFVVHFKLQFLLDDFFGLMTLGGMFFACGLPGWAMVRWLFNYIIKHQASDIGQIIDDARKRVAGG